MARLCRIARDVWVPATRATRGPSAASPSGRALRSWLLAAASRRTAGARRAEGSKRPAHAIRQDFNNGALPEEGQAELLHWLEEGLDDGFLGFPEGEQSVPTPVKVIVDDTGVTLDGGAGERLRRDANRIGQAQ